MDRRGFFKSAATAMLVLAGREDGNASARADAAGGRPGMSGNKLRLFLCGDVMTGRGIDQILPHPCDPVLYESYMKSALGYIEIAEAANGPIPRPVGFDYIWGDALSELDRESPDLRIINLETAVTANDDPWPYKGINYRMHPDNVPCITAAGIDCCVLANNHVLDWGYPGLEETLDVLGGAGVSTAGAGRNAEQARAPAIFEAGGKGRVAVYAVATTSSGVHPAWAATGEKAGVSFVRDLSRDSVQKISDSIRDFGQAGDIVVLSIHWGGNWGYAIPGEQREFAHRIIDEAGVDVIHGHSSHHPRGIEVYRDRPIIYGCGDLINDYEGIRGHQQYRGDLSLMYFLDIDPATGRLSRLRMTPMSMARFRLNRASAEEAHWLAGAMDRECRSLGASVERASNQELHLHWD